MVNMKCGETVDCGSILYIKYGLVWNSIPGRKVLRVRRHKKKRIDKKWQKRYGFKFKYEE